jgi:hypothetical protein
LSSGTVGDYGFGGLEFAIGLGGRDKPGPAELPLALQDHRNAVRYRNIWVRRLAGYDQPEK